MMRFFISGTGTGVGKTVFAGLFARDFLRGGKSVRYVKPVQTGHPPDDDAAVVREMSGLPPERARILYSAPEPVAPSWVFDPFPFDDAVAQINAVADAGVLIVESAGGLLAPLGGGKANADFIKACGLTVILVTPNRLGALNEAMLNLYYLTRERAPFHGFAVNDHLAPDADFAARNKRELAKLAPGKTRYVFDEAIKRLI
ncbi:MAG: dethiobiotin synthase [Desulfovibrionaceae bacterium]|nr:dethiobiotin synthase [Desulfovibrionaceae bacterium]MBF0515443.1 dethiobiotin synthase [Desulfovibrionaceae bacterium]